MAKKVIQAQMQQRRDTAANWAASNPVLLEGELGIVTDDPNLYKIGDGVTAWNDLKFRGFDGTLVQTTGDSENAVMSQKAVTSKLTELESEVIGNRAEILRTLAAGSDYYGSAYQLSYSANEGDNIYIELTLVTAVVQSGTTPQITLYYTDGTNEKKNIPIGVRNQIILPKALSSISLTYVYGDNITTSGTINMAVGVGGLKDMAEKTNDEALRKNKQDLTASELVQVHNNLQVVSSNEVLRLTDSIRDSLADGIAYADCEVSEVANKWINASGGLESNSNYHIAYTKVSFGERYYLKHKTDHIGGVAKVYAFYSSDNFSAENLVAIGESFGTTQQEFHIVAPATAQYLAVTYQNNMGEYIRKEVPILSDKTFSVSVGEDVVVSRNYNGTHQNTFTLTMGRCGVNNIFAFKKLSWGGEVPMEDIVGTDWVGPYVIRLSDTDSSSWYGGWHGSTGGQDGLPTARTREVKVYIDNKQQEQGTWKCDDVKIKVVNEILAFRTDSRVVLTEEVTYNFSNDRIYVTNTITALEDLSINRYYGMQFAGFSDATTFIGAEVINRGKITSEYYASYMKTQKIIREYTDGRKVEGVMDNIALGMYAYSPEENAMATNVDKAYFILCSYNYLTNGKQLNLSANAKAYWSGCYRFFE